MNPPTKPRPKKPTETRNPTTKTWKTLRARNIDDGVYVTNGQDSIIYLNKGMEKIAGVASNRILNVNVLNGFRAETLAVFRPLYVTAKETLKRIKYDSIPVTTPDGRFMYQSGEIIPIIKKGVFDGTIVVVKDNTEKKTYIDKLENNIRKENAMHKQAIELSEAKNSTDVGVCIVEVLVKTLGLTV